MTVKPEAVQAVPEVPAAPVIPEVPKQAKAAKVEFNGVLHDVKSSSVAQIGFDPVGAIGVVYNSGKTFVYADCTPDVFNQLAQSKSVGSAVRTLLADKKFSEVK